MHAELGEGTGAPTTTTAMQTTTTAVQPTTTVAADALITNEYAHWQPDADDAVRSTEWDMTSGSLFRRDGISWSGRPDDVRPNATSSNGTNSAVFRLTTTEVYGDVDVAFDLVHHGFVATPSTPAAAWDGVHVLLRYQGEEHLYHASVNRRDGRIAIKKKVPGGSSNGGTYYTLVRGDLSFTAGAVQHIRTRVATNSDGSVTISVLGADGHVVLSARDEGVGGAPITSPGRVGIRGDNTEFSFDNFTVLP